MLKILIVDDHEVVREGLKLVLDDWRRDIDWVSAASAAESRQLALEHARFDLIILDLKLPDSDRFELLDFFISSDADAPVAIFSAEDRLSIIREAIEHGAKAYINKSSPQETVNKALDTVLAGGVYKPEENAGEEEPQSGDMPEAVDILEKVKALSKRQLDILVLIAQGQTNKQIAESLSMSPATVRSYLTIVFRALGVKNRTQAVHLAGKLGVIDRI